MHRHVNTIVILKYCRKAHWNLKGKLLWLRISILNKGKGEGTVQPRTGHEDPEEK